MFLPVFQLAYVTAKLLKNYNKTVKIVFKWKLMGELVIDE